MKTLVSPFYAANAGSGSATPETPSVSAVPTNSAGTPLTPVQQDADKAIDDGGAVATDFVNKEPATTISADAATFLKDLEQLGYDEVKTLLADFLEFKGQGVVNSFTGFFTHLGTQIGGLISKL